MVGGGVEGGRRHTLNRHTTTETRVTYDNSTWHAMDTRYINSTKETSLIAQSAQKETRGKMILSVSARVNITSFF